MIWRYAGHADSKELALQDGQTNFEPLALKKDSSEYSFNHILNIM